MKKTAVFLRLDEKTMIAFKIIADKEKWSLAQTAEEAVKFYLRTRKQLK